MNVEKIVEAFGSQAKLTKALNWNNQSKVRYYVVHNSIPYWVIPEFKKAARKLGINIDEYLK